MAAISTMVAAVGVGVAAAGVGTQLYGASQSAEANEAAIAAQQRAEAIRLQAAKVDAARKQRQFIREQVIARAQALSTTTNQGANESSGLPGAYGQIAGRTAFGISGIQIAQATGQGLYGANQDLLQAKLAANDAASISAIGSGLTSLGGAITGNLGAIDRVFSGFGGGGSTGGINLGFANPNAGSGSSYGIIGVGPYG